MYHVLAIFCLCNNAIASVIPQDRDAVILSYEYKNYGGGNYQFSYLTSNGIERKETGQAANAGQKNEYISVRGQYTYTQPDGLVRTARYSADLTGYHVHFEPSSTTMDDNNNNLDTLSYRLQSVSPQVLASLLG